jgi:enoyl-CoA hydratase
MASLAPFDLVKTVNLTQTYDTLTCSVNDGIALVTLNRPDSLNALSFRMMDELGVLFGHTLGKDAGVRCIVLTGAGGKAFCAGADIKERAGRNARTAETFAALRGTVELFRQIEECEKPVLAAINGYAMGGGLEIALCCDIRLAATHARLGLPELRLGALPAAGGTQRLSRLIGTARTKEFLFTGEPVDAAEALRLGLVNRVVDPDQLLDEALDMARKIAGLAPLAVQFAKRAVHMGSQVGLEAGLEFERYAASILMDTDDRREGMRAFVEKRAPRFTGN